MDITVRYARDAKIRGLETRLRDPSGKSNQLIISHVLNDSGFVDGCLDVFHGGYHYGMDGNRSKTWFTSFLGEIAADSVIAWNVSVHSPPAGLSSRNG